MKSAKANNPKYCDPLQNHRDIEALVVQKKVTGDLKKYYRFRRDRWYGGIITADTAGCGLDCNFCWVRSDELRKGGGKGDFLSPDEVAAKFFALIQENKIYQVRISGGEPTIGRRHLLRLLGLFQNKRIRFILESNGILIGADESYAEDLALFPFVHVRISLKGCSEGEFARMTGADPKGFNLQLAALKNLVKAGVSANPAVMISFSTKEAIDRLYGVIWKIDPRLHSDIEREEVILYPHVQARLEKCGLLPRNPHGSIDI